MAFRNGIIIFMGLFMVFIVTLGILMQREGSDLVSDDYYAHDRAYQQEMEAMQLANRFNNALRINQTLDSLEFVWKEGRNPSPISLYFMRPNNKKFDKVFEINVNDHKSVRLPKSLFEGGNYQVEARYTMSGDSCLQRIVLRIK